MKNLLEHLFWLAKYTGLHFCIFFAYENADPYDVFTLAMVIVRSYMFSGSFNYPYIINMTQRLIR